MTFELRVELFLLKFHSEDSRYVHTYNDSFLSSLAENINDVDGVGDHGERIP